MLPMLPVLLCECDECVPVPPERLELVCLPLLERRDAHLYLCPLHDGVPGVEHAAPLPAPVAVEAVQEEQGAQHGAHLVEVQHGLGEGALRVRVQQVGALLVAQRLVVLLHIAPLEPVQRGR